MSINGDGKAVITSSNANATYKYSTDGNPPSTAYDSENPIDITDVVTIKAIAIVDGEVSNEVTYTVGNGSPYLIQNQECTAYYMVPEQKESGNISINTSSVAGPKMEWFIRNAGAVNGLQYYYIVNKSTSINSSYNYLTYTASNGTKIYFGSNSDKLPSGDAYKFYFRPNTDGSYSIYPKGVMEKSFHKDQGNRAYPNIVISSNISMPQGTWKFIPSSDYAYVAPTDDAGNALTLSAESSGVAYYYVASVGTADSYIVSNAATSTSGSNQDKSWMLMEAGTDSWQTYYYLVSAVTGKYLHFLGTSNNTSTLANAVEMTDLPDSPTDNYKFVLARATDANTYYIIPKTHYECFEANKFYCLSNTGSQINAVLTRAEKNNTDEDINAKWKFSSATLFCASPIAKMDNEGNVTLSCPTFGSEIRFTADGKNPDTEGATTNTYNTESWSPSTQALIKAIARLKSDNTVVSQDGITILNNPDVTLSQDTYTYNGEAQIPTISEVSITINGVKTTAASDTYEIDEYVNNTNAGSPSSENPPTVTLKDADAGDNWYIWNASQTFTINPALVTVTADDTTKEYGTDDPAWTATVTGMQNGESATDLIHYTISRTESGEDVGGTYAITPTGDAAQGNYSVSYVAGTLTIEPKAVTVTADNKTKTYGETDPALSVTIAGLVNGDTESVISYTISRAEGEAAGDYIITPTGEDSQGNYTVTYPTGTLTINKADLTATADNMSVTYGDATPTYTISYADFVNGEDASVITTPPTITCDYSPTSNVGEYTISVSGNGEATNYNIIAGTPGTLTVGQKEVGIGEWSNTTVTYNGSAQTPTATVDSNDLVNGDGIGVEVTVTGGGVNAGSYTAKASGLTGNKAGNYKLPDPAPTSPFTINKAQLMAVNLENAEFIYNGEEQSVTITNVTAGDGTLVTVSDVPSEEYEVSGNSATNAGTHTVTVTPKSPSTNYDTDVSQSNSFTIGKKSIGDGTDPATASGITIDITWNDNESNPYTVEVKDGESLLAAGTEGTGHAYSLSATGDHDTKYYTVTITGANNYNGSFTAKYANVIFDSDGSPGAMWYGTFVAEADHVTPTGMTPYIITSVADNTATAVELDYIPNGVPVVLMNAEDAKGFLVQSGTGEISTTGNLLAVQATDEEKATATVYLLYKGEFVLNKAGTLEAGTVYLPVSSGSGARLKISRGDNTGIENIEYTIESQSDAWYTLDGRRLSSKPTKKGVYLQGGKKIVVK